jgi:hypothetical protein
MEGAEFRKAHSAMVDGRVSWTSEAAELVQPSVLGGEMLYEQRRRLNAQVGLVAFALPPSLAILIAVGLSLLRMLMVEVLSGVSIAITLSS